MFEKLKKKTILKKKLPNIKKKNLIENCFFL